jgi:hypothetical protein
MRYERDLADPDDSVPVVTYSRTTSSRRRSPAPRAERVAPYFDAAEFAVPERDELGDVPEVHAFRTARPRREATLTPDLVGEERRPRFVKVVVMLGVLALVGGAGVLAAAYNQAVNAPIDQSADVAPVGPAAATSASATASAPHAAPDTAVRDVMLAPTVPAPAGVAVAPAPAMPATAAPAVTEDASAPAVAPSPHPRPQDGASVQAQTDGAASGQSDMDQLMDHIGQILATIPPEDETTPSSASSDLPTLPGASAEAGASVATQSGALSTVTPSGVLTPVTVSGDAGASASAPPSASDAPTPPASIPDASPLSVLR